MSASETDSIASSIARRERLLRRLKGDEKLVALYMLIEQRLIERKVGRLCQVEVSEAHTDIIVCNLWRVRRFPDGHAEVAAYSWVAQDYVTQSPGEKIPKVFAIPFWPIFNSHSLTWWQGLIAQAVWHTFEQSCATLKMTSTTSRKRKSGVRIGFIGHLILRRMIGKWEWLGFEGARASKHKKLEAQLSANPRNTKDEFNNKIHRAGIYTHETMKAGARALRASIFEHLLHRPVFSGMLSIDFMNISLQDYLLIVTQPEVMAGFIRVSEESRHLLPLMPHIPIQEWSRSDVFGRAHWVKPLDAEAKQAPAFPAVVHESNDLDDQYTWRRLGFNASMTKPLACTSRANWRFLKSLPNKLVQAWIRGGYDDTLLRIWREGGLTPKTSPHVAIAIDRRFNAGLAPDFYLEARIRAVRLLINAAQTVRKREGVAGLIGWLHGREGNIRNPDGHEYPTAELDHVSDYLRNVGYAAGQPDQHQTWATMQALSDAWHEAHRIAKNGLTDRDKHFLAAITWECCLPAANVDGYAFTGLLDGLALVTEGLEQDHCVDTYVLHGRQNTHRFWKMEHAERNERLTLSIVMDGKVALLDQCYRRRNRLPGKAAVEAAMKFVKDYNVKLAGRKLDALG